LIEGIFHETPTLIVKAMVCSRKSLRENPFVGFSQLTCLISTAGLAAEHPQALVEVVAKYQFFKLRKTHLIQWLVEVQAQLQAL